MGVCNSTRNSITQVENSSSRRKMPSQFSGINKDQYTPLSSVDPTKKIITVKKRPKSSRSVYKSKSIDLDKYLKE